MMEQKVNNAIWLNSDQNVIQDALESIATPVGLVEVRDDGTFAPIAFNHHLVDFYNIDFAPLVESRSALSDVTEEHASDIPQAIDYIARAIENYETCVKVGKPVEFETSYVDGKTGRESWSVNTMVPIKKMDRVARILVTMVDTTYKHTDQGTSPDSALASCAWCEKKVKELDAEEWESVMHYFHRKGVSVSHGICNECLKDVESLMT